MALEDESQQILEPIDGLLMAKNCSVTRFREATSYKPTSDDIFIASFHKSGTTWLQYIVFHLSNGAKLENPFVHEMMLDYGPRIEQLGIKAKDDGIKRHFKTHLPFNYVPFNREAKYIYVIRNPWDVCVSYYSMLSQMPQFYGFKNGSFDIFFTHFINGYNDSGSYFDHVREWVEKRGKEENILFLRYGELKSDPKATITKIGTFLGGKCLESVQSEETLNKILDLTSFDSMKILPFVLPSSFEVIKRTGVINVGKNVDQTVNSGDYKRIDFFKVGKSGYAKHQYTEQQKKLMNQMIEIKFRNFPDLLNDFIIQ